MIFCISIDLDPLWCYRDIYGLDYVDEPDPVTELATRRFCGLMEEIGILGTLFVVGRSQEEVGAAAALRDASRLGHEIANHTQSHPYDLSKRSTDAIAREITAGADAIEKATGERPVGFRAPGYLLGTQVLPALADCGAVYDSSVLPSPAYQGLKMAAMGYLAICGRPSGAQLGDPREFLGPIRPYRPDPVCPWRRGSAPFIEIPISCVFGLPLVGTSLSLLGPSRVAWLASAASRLAFVCLELHGVDLMDITADGLDPALGVQRDLRIPWERKAQTIMVFAERLLRTHQAMTLQQATELLVQGSEFRAEPSNGS